MSGLLFWFGLLHAVAYAVAGFSLASTVFVDWIVRRFKLKAQLLRTFQRMLQERNKKDFHGA